jgi:hypothetical protein
LNGKIDREKYRAACYGLSVLCGLFRLETPIEAKVTAETKNTLDAVFNLTPEQRQRRIDELTEKMFPGYEEYETWAEEKKRRELMINNGYNVSPNVPFHEECPSGGHSKEVNQPELDPVPQDTDTHIDNSFTDKKKDKKLYGIGAKHGNK